MALRALGRSRVMTATPLGKTRPFTKSSAVPAMATRNRTIEAIGEEGIRAWGKGLEDGAGNGERWSPADGSGSEWLALAPTWKAADGGNYT